MDRNNRNSINKDEPIYTVKRHPVVQCLSLIFKLIVSLCAITAQADPNSDNREFQEWLKQEDQDLKQFISKEDQEFADFLKKEWTAFQVFQGKIRPTKPKPARPPRVTHALATLIQPGTATHGARQLDAALLKGRFFGHVLAPLRVPVTTLPPLRGSQNQAIASSWEVLANQDHQALLAELEKHRTKLGLGDWGYLQLTLYFLQPLFPDRNERLVYAWFLMNKSGYDVRLGYSERAFTLLIPSRYPLYSVRYSEIGDKTYYMYPQLEDAEVYSYEDHVDEYLDTFQFDLSRLPASSALSQRLELKVQVSDSEFVLPVELDPGQIAFRREYPNLDLVWYFRGQMLADTDTVFLDSLRPHLEGLSQRQAVDFLIQLTQALFSYKTDQEQFGTEKYLMADESFFYSYNDCEDRSIFLAWLLTKLVNIQPIILDYPNHIALAVPINLRPSDQYIEYEGHKYVIADPTYIGAKSGMGMPDLAQVEPNVIVP